MMDVPFFDRWRAKLIANLDPESVGELDSIRFAPVAPTVAVVCPFLRWDGEPCEQLITYYLQVGSGAEDDLSYALGACHRHLAHAFDVLFTADRVGLADACDDDAVDASIHAAAPQPPELLEDVELVERLVAGGTVIAADFGTTALHEGYPTVRGASVSIAPHVAERLEESGVLELARELGIDVGTTAGGEVTLSTPEPDGADEWIAQNCALRELLSDVLDNNVDPIGYRYRTIADALPEFVALEPRVFTNERCGDIAVRARIVLTPAERTWDRELDADRRHTVRLFVDEVPRPGDYLDVTFARYRFSRVAPSEDGVYEAETVLERIKQPSRN